MPNPQGDKHHYIPKFYLKQWAGQDRRICEFSRPYSEVQPRMTYPDGTGYQRGLYSFPELPPAIADFLEHRFFKRADDGAHDVLQLLLSDKLDFDINLRTI